MDLNVSIWICMQKCVINLSFASRESGQIQGILAAIIFEI